LKKISWGGGISKETRWSVDIKVVEVVCETLGTREKSAR